MKKLLLLSALLILACSSDDSSDSDDNDLMEETFLERYDGVVWEHFYTFQGEEEVERNMFTNTPKAFFNRGGEFDDVETWCNTFLYNTPYPDGSIAQIIENSGDILIVEKTFVSHTEFINWEVVDNGNTLTITATATSTDIFGGEVFNLAMNRTSYPQITCNN